MSNYYKKCYKTKCHYIGSVTIEMADLEKKKKKTAHREVKLHRDLICGLSSATGPSLQ